MNTVRRRYVMTILIFMSMAVVGPLIRWLTWPPFGKETATPVQLYVYDLVFLLWPAQVFVAIEDMPARIDWWLNLLFSVGANFLLFGVLGAVAGVLLSPPKRLVFFFFALCFWEFLVVIWLTGKNPAYFDLLALATVLVVYAIPCWVAFRISTKRKKCNNRVNNRTIGDRPRFNAKLQA